MKQTNKRCRHKWDLVKDSGVYKYYECAKCRERTFKSLHTGYQPLRTDWLSGRKVNL